jgi:hypothetical protein
MASSKKSQNKTVATDASVIDFLETVTPEKKKEEAYRLLELFKSVTKLEPKMWGSSIIGFGTYHYKYDSGREGDFLLTGFSPRKAKHSIYILSGFSSHDDLMSKLGKYKTGKSCLYVNKLDDIDLKVLKQLIKKSVKYIKEKYPSNNSN